MLELKTNQLKTRKKVLIDEHQYTVRKLGNIEQMDLSQYMRRLDVLSNLEKKQDLTEKQIQEVQDIGNRISNLFIALFDDGGDQSKSRSLVASLSENEIGVLLGKIFEEGTVEETLSGSAPAAS